MGLFNLFNRKPFNPEAPTTPELKQRAQSNSYLRTAQDKIMSSGVGTQRDRQLASEALEQKVRPGSSTLHINPLPRTASSLVRSHSSPYTVQSVRQFGKVAPNVRESSPAITPAPQVKGTSTWTIGNTMRTPESDRFVKEVIEPIAKEYNVPMRVAGGMFGVEGRMGGVGAERNNFYNINAVDSDPTKAFVFDTPEDGVRAYMDFITGKSNTYASPEHQQNFLKAYEDWLVHGDDRQFMIDIQNAGYAGDPTDWTQRKLKDDPQFNTRAYPSYADFIMYGMPEWRMYDQ